MSVCGFSTLEIAHTAAVVFSEQPSDAFSLRTNEFLDAPTRLAPAADSARARRRRGRASTRRSAPPGATATPHRIVAASTFGSVICQQVNCSSTVLVIERCGSGGGSGSGWGRGSSLTAVRSWLTVATWASCRIMRIRSHPGPGRDHPDLIQRQPALPQARRAARKLAPVETRWWRWCGRWLTTTRSSRPPTPAPTGAGDTHQPAAIQLGHDLHDAPIDGVALTGQLRQLLKQHLNTIDRAHPRGARRSGRGQNPIIAAMYDNFGCPMPAANPPHLHSAQIPATKRGFRRYQPEVPPGGLETH